MITSIKFGKTYQDVQNYAKYCVSPKHGDTDYQHGERVLLIDSDYLNVPLCYTEKEESLHLSKTIASDFQEHSKRKEYANKMVCGSISFHPEDNVDEHKAIEIARKQVKDVIGETQTLYVVHGDKDHLHVHFMSNTTLIDGTRFKDSMCYRKFELSNENLENEYGLTKVAQRIACARNDKTREVKVNAPKSQAIYLAEKGELTPSEYIKANVKLALDLKLSFPDFLENLKHKDIHLSPNIARTGACSGVSYYMGDMKGSIKGSDLGKLFAWKSIQEITNYEQDRDFESLKRCKHDSISRTIESPTLPDDREHGPTPGNVAGSSNPYHREIERDNQNIDRTGNRASEKNTIYSGHYDPTGGFGSNRTKQNSTGDESRTRSMEGRAQEQGVDDACAWFFDWPDISSSLDRVIHLAADEELRNKTSEYPNLTRATTAAAANHAIKKQIETIGHNIDITIRAKNYETGEVKVINDCSDKSIKYMQHLNSTGFNILIRPDNNNIVVIDDINGQGISKIKSEGYQPAMVIKTSNDNHQVWFKMNGISDEATKKNVQKVLAEKFGGDKASTDAEHFFRCAGFTNRKEKHKTNGKYPYCIILENTGFVLSEKAQNTLKQEANKILETERANKIESNKIYNVNLADSNAREFYKRYFNYTKIADYSALDYGATCEMIKTGFTDESIYDALLHCSPNIDGRKKDHVDDYIQRTIKNAHATVALPITNAIVEMENDLCNGSSTTGMKR